MLNVEGEGERGVHVYAERGAEVTIHHEREGERRELATSSGKSKVGDQLPRRLQLAVRALFLTLTWLVV